MQNTFMFCIMLPASYLYTMVWYTWPRMLVSLLKALPLHCWFYRCEGCKQLVPAHKQLTLYDDPNVLVIHLKRFDGIFGAKISRDIAFSETLDIEPYMCSSRRFNGCNASGGSSSSSRLVNGYTSNSSSSLSNGYPSSNGHSSSINNQCSSNGSSVSSISRGAHPADSRVSPGQYELHGVVVHHGFSANSGHYLAYVKDGVPPTGHWHCMNDSQVRRWGMRRVGW